VDFLEQVKLELVRSWVRGKGGKEKWRSILLEKMTETLKEMVMGKMMVMVIKMVSLRVPVMVIIEILEEIKTVKAMLQNHFDVLYDDCLLWVDLEQQPPAAASDELYCQNEQCS
jgi:hypothetical protein